jgi:cytochrome c-type biogenesis protein CcmH/NrfG
LIIKGITTMGNKKESKLIKLETSLLFSFIALLIGFLGGVVFSAYKLGSDPALTKNMAPHTEEEHGMSQGVSHAIETLEAKVTKSPDDVASWIELGHIYFDNNMPDKAIKSYKTALKLQPNNVNVWTDLGVMYRRSGSPKDALAAFAKAQGIDPRHEVSLFNTGVVQMHDLNNPKGAITAWEKLLKLNPSAKTPSGQLVQELVSKIKQNQK